MNSSLMIILIGTSGAGKTTLRDYSLYRNNRIKKLIAITDRLPRIAEIDGIDKYFVSSSVFQDLKRQGKLCLINMIYDNMYAFRRKDFEEGGVFLGELHYAGLKDFLAFHPNTISIYIRVKEIDALRGLYTRGSSEEEILRRKSLQLVEIERLELMHKEGCFDYVFNNDYTDISRQNFYDLIRRIIKQDREA